MSIQNTSIQIMPSMIGGFSSGDHPVPGFLETFRPTENPEAPLTKGG
jgi:hypothetical protein